MLNDAPKIIASQLSPNEQLLWFGKPRQGFFFRASDALLIPFSLLWGGFAIFWETLALKSDSETFFKFWGIPFVLVGLYFIFGRFFVDVRHRKKTFYAVTNERVIIVSGLFGQSMTSLDLDKIIDLTLNEKKNETGTVIFGTINSPSMIPDRDYIATKKYRPAPLNFEQIEKAKSVYEIIRNAQKQFRQLTTR